MHGPGAARGARVRVIAGELANIKGPALTYSELNVWDVRMSAGSVSTLPIPAGHNAALALLRGAISVNGTRRIAAPAMVMLDRVGDAVALDATDADAVLLMLSGVPFDEPVVGYGPFVMNSRSEIETAIRDFQSGKFGRMVVPEPSRAD